MMEKFAVDLEKVLDEFEYNEEREENVSAPSIRNPPLQSLGAFRQVVPARPPAASYRRPSFEPINLAEADFAASPPKSAPIYSHGPVGKPFSLLTNNLQSNNKNHACVNDNVSSFTSDVNINKQVIIESDDSNPKIWHKNNTLSVDEKPDLLEYNSKNTDFDPKHLDVKNQLPDLTTSVGTINCYDNNNEIESISNSLDLISSARNSFSTEREENDKNEEELRQLEISNVMPFDMHDTLNYQNDNKELLEQSVFANYESNENASFSKGLSEFVNSSGNPSTITDTIPIPDLNDNENSSEQDVVETLPNCESSECSYQENEIETSYTDSVSELVEQKKTLESSKPIGFLSNTDLSDNELEEYLKELEELDEFDSREKCLDISNQSNTEEEKVDEQVFNNKTANVEENISKQSNFSNSEESALKKEETTDNGNSLHSTINSKTENLTNSILEHSLNIEKNSLSHIPSVASEQEGDSVPQTSTISCQPSENLCAAISEYKNVTKTESDVCLETSDLKTALVKDKSQVNSENNQIAENISKTHFQEGDDVEKLTENMSTNPFDEGDCSHSSDEFDAKKQSTNPFDEDDEDDFSKEESISESSLPPKMPDTSSQCEAIGIMNNEVNEKEEILSLPQQTVNSGNEEKTAELLTNPSFNLKNEATANMKPTNSNNPSSTSSGFENDCTDLSLPGCSSSLSNSMECSAKMIPIKTAIESPSLGSADEVAVALEEDKPLRPNSLELPSKITVDATSVQSPGSVAGGELVTELVMEERRLGKIAPFWVPDTDTTMCMQCQMKFNVLKRRHHCRACGQVLCYKCCSLKARLEYMNFTEARVCQPCFTILEAMSESDTASPPRRQPNPNNPMEYCSTIPPLQQAAGSLHQPPPSVMVPVGVLKREGRVKSEVTKQVMFSDGIRPGGDLTELDGSGEQPRMPFRRPGRLTKRVGTPPGGMLSPTMRRVMDPVTLSFIPAEGDNSLPPVITRLQGEVSYSDWESPVINLSTPPVKFAINRNLFVVVKRVMLECCVNRMCWCLSSEGLACVGQDEIVFLLECLPDEKLPPKDIFFLINSLYQDAAKGSTVSEMSFTPAQSNSLLGSRDHGGFLYIRTTFQCTDQLVLPNPPYLVALLVHRWETPWARLFPIRLVLRLGAEFRYYPCPLVSVRNRPPLYTDIGHTIINILADFRKYSYTLPSVRGLTIHMEDRQTTINIPRNRYDQVVRALNNSNDSVLAFGANLSLSADSHLVCMQSSEDENTSYHTQAINIHNKPRKVTGASFVVFNGALKTPGLTGKSNIVEDGLMVQVPGETMVALRTALRDMRDYSIGCGPNSEETVLLQWGADDTNFNIGVKSCIDGKSLDGVPSIRVHNGTDYSGGTRIIRWTEVFILQCEDSEHSSEPLDISRLSESIARATCLALVPLLDLLTAASLTTLAVRTTIHPDNVGYEAGSNGEKLPPLYMKSLDDELVMVVHQAALASQENPAVLELVFRVMEQG